VHVAALRPAVASLKATQKSVRGLGLRVRGNRDTRGDTYLMIYIWRKRSTHLHRSLARVHVPALRPAVASLKATQKSVRGLGLRVRGIRDTRGDTYLMIYIWRKRSFLCTAAWLGCM